MLLNLTENPQKGNQTINEEVGNNFSADQIEEIHGNNSGLMEIASSSIDIFNLLVNSPGMKTGNIEIRPDGIIVYFQADLEKYALVIPYYKLQIYKGKAKEYSVYRDNQYLKFKVDRKENHEFFRKVRNLKFDHWTSQKPW